MILQLSLMPAIWSAFLIRSCVGTMCPCEAIIAMRSSNAWWHALYFFPLPHQHGSFLPIFTDIISAPPDWSHFRLPCPLFLLAATSANFSVIYASTSSADIICGAYSAKISYLVWYSAKRSSLLAGQVSICSFTDFISFKITLFTSSSLMSSLHPSSIAAFFAAETSVEIASLRTLSLAFMAAIISFCNVSNCITILPSWF